MTGASPRVGAVVVDYNVGPPLKEAVLSLLDDGITDLVVVENGAPGSTAAALGELAEQVLIVAPGENVGFGAGVNRGVAELDGDVELVVVSNPDVRVHRGAIMGLTDALVAHPEWGIAGPTIVGTNGAVYPSVRRFPSPLDAVGHALLGLITPENRFSRRYRSSGTRPDGGVDWVSGAFFVIRHGAFEQLGGFDEAYFMFAEDIDLCWRAHKAGVGVGVAPTAIVTHTEGVARRAHPYKMLVAHHRSALRFANVSTTGVARAALPVAALVLGVRLIGAVMMASFRRVLGSMGR